MGTQLDRHRMPLPGSPRQATPPVGIPADCQCQPEVDQGGSQCEMPRSNILYEPLKGEGRGRAIALKSRTVGAPGSLQRACLPHAVASMRR